MKTIGLIALTTAIMATASLQGALAAQGGKQAYRTFSRARLIKIINNICGPHGNPQLCCRMNEGVWHLVPRPPHCIYM